MKLALLSLVGAMLTTTAAALVASVVAAISLARDEDAHPADCVAPCCDVGPDDLMDLAEAVGVVRKPFALDVAVDTAIRSMPVDESTVWIATARDIGHLDTYDAAEWSR